VFDLASLDFSVTEIYQCFISVHRIIPRQALSVVHQYTYVVGLCVYFQRSLGLRPSTKQEPLRLCSCKMFYSRDALASCSPTNWRQQINLCERAN